MRLMSLIILISALAVFTQTSQPPLPFPELKPEQVESEAWPPNTEIPYQIRALHYKKGLFSAVNELNRTISENSSIDTGLTSMIIAVVASRNRCLY